MNFIKYLTWNIKKYKKLIFNIFISILIGFVFSGCKVQAVATKDYISIDSSYTRVKRDVNFYNDLFNNYYGRSDIDISTFTGISSYLEKMTNQLYSIAIIPAPENKMWIRGCYTTSDLKMYLYGGVYTLSGNYAVGIDFDNNKVFTLDQYANNMSLASVEESQNLSSTVFQSNEYQKSLIYNYVLYYHGIINSTRNTVLTQYQEHNKNTYWDYTEDDIYSYWSGDITLYDNYFEVKDFETNVSDYSMYLLSQGVYINEFGEYEILSGISDYEISKPNQGGTSTWQITNISDNTSGDINRIYAIGIGTPETPWILRSEWFDSDENLSDFMNSPSFRLRNYIEDLPEFFIPTESSGSGDSEIIPPSGDDTEIVGGIKGIWQAVLNLPKMILDGLVGLFVPSEGFFSSYFDELLTWFEERLGILGYPITFTVDVLNRILDLDFNEPVISWDDMYVPLFEDEVPLIPAGEINFKTLVESNETILNFYNTYLIIVDGLLVFMIIKLIQRKHDEIVGGASE